MEAMVPLHRLTQLLDQQHPAATSGVAEMPAATFSDCHTAPNLKLKGKTLLIIFS